MVSEFQLTDYIAAAEALAGLHAPLFVLLDSEIDVDSITPV